MNKKITRRGFLVNILMWGGLVVSYGAGALYVFRYLLPQKKEKQLRKIYVAPLVDIKAGKSIKFKLPDGSEALVLRFGEKIQALSNTCPHLGCKVKWRGQEQDFFCPCHNGIFNPEGISTAGPPATEKKNLKQYDLEVIGQSVFIKIEEA